MWSRGLNDLVFRSLIESSGSAHSCEGGNQRNEDTGSPLARGRATIIRGRLPRYFWRSDACSCCRCRRIERKIEKLRYRVEPAVSAAEHARAHEREGKVPHSCDCASELPASRGG